MSRINAFYTYFLGKYWQIKTKQLESEYFTFSRKSDFQTFTLGEQWQIKLKKLKSKHYYTFWKCYIQVALRTMQCRCFFIGVRTNFKKKRLCTCILGEQWQIKIINQNQDTASFENAIYKRCSIYTKEEISPLFLQSTKNFKYKLLFCWEFGQISTNKNEFSKVIK